MFSKAFWLDTAERAIRTAAQGAIVALSGAALDKIDYQQAGLAVLSLTVLSVLTSLVGSRRGSPDSASLLKSHGADEPAA